MKILYISEYYPPYIKGGAEISTSLLVQNIQKFNKCFVLTSKLQNKNWKEKRVPVFPQLHIISITSASFFSYIKYFIMILIGPIFNLWITIRIIKELKVDIVHIVPTSYLLLPLIIVPFLLRKRIVVDIRDYSAICPTGAVTLGCAEQQYRNHGFHCFKGSYAIPKLYRFIAPLFMFYEYSLFLLYRGIFRLIYNLSSSIKIVTLSHFMNGQMIDAGFISKRMSVIYNIANDIKVKTYNKKLQIIFAGRLEQAKGVWDVILAYKKLKISNLKLIIIGSGKESNELNKYIRNEKVKGVILKGRVSQKKLLPMIASSLLIIAPSRWPEPFGRFIFDAMITKTPIIATKIGGIVEAVKDGSTGILVPPAQPDKLANAIKKLLNNKSLYHKMQNQLVIDKKNYLKETIIPQRLTLYDELMNPSI